VPDDSGAPPVVDHRDAAWAALLRRGPCDLTRAEFLAALPPRGAAGSLENRIRRARVAILDNRGFRIDGRRISY
jgi:hypothetical protein